MSGGGGAEGAGGLLAVRNDLLLDASFFVLGHGTWALCGGLPRCKHLARAHLTHSRLVDAIGLSARA